MRITVAPDLDLDVAVGATVAQVREFLVGRGKPMAGEWWCGTTLLDADHPAGTMPLVHGAVVRSQPGPVTVVPDGPHIAVVAGPDAGHIAPLGATDLTIGRDSASGLVIDDPAISRTHLRVSPGPSAHAIDAGSINGTTVRHSEGATRSSRRVALPSGAAIEIGRSLLHVRPVEQGDTATPLPTPRERLSGSRLAGMGGGAMAGVMMAVVTGRWYFALLALAYPAALVVPAILARWRGAAQAEPPLPPQLPEVCGHVPATESLPAGPIAVTGEEPWASGFARAIVIHRGTRPAPGQWSEPWMSWLGAPDSDSPLLLVSPGESAPSWCPTVAHASAQGVTIRSHGRDYSLPPVRVTAQSASLAARRRSASAATHTLPSVVRWADLATITAPARHLAGTPRRLATAVAAQGSGAFVMDLDTHGPHLLVAGTTGAGKSAFLETLILGLAHDHSPEDLALALIDFKGGAGLRSCMSLPHVAGVLTDLDTHLAQRALTALAREVSDRKTALASAGHTSFHAWERAGGAPSRLVVVADEYQEVTAHHREFLPDLARLAAQGRSLGVHLILATQRPAGAVTPEIRANVGTTIALRVASESESRDLVGTADASLLPRSAPGRAIVAHGSERTTVQVALPIATRTPAVQLASESASVEGQSLETAVLGRWPRLRRPHALWQEPLPTMVKPHADNGRVMVGLGDWPRERRQDPVDWDPATGPIVVAGPPGSGRTTALRTIASQAHLVGLTPTWLPSDPREAARTIALAAQRPDCLVVIDDALAALATLADVDRGAPVDALTTLVARGAPVAMALPVTGHHRLATHASTRVILTGAQASDEAMWSVPRELQGLPPLPGRAVVSTRGGWCESQIAVTENHVDSPLVAPLPESITERQARMWPPHTLGIGGDDAAPVELDVRRAVTIIGPPGSARDHVAARVQDLLTAVSPTPSMTVADSVLMLPGASVGDSTVLITEPSHRAVTDAARTSVAGVVDPVPVPARVVLVDRYGVRAVQLPEPATTTTATTSAEPINADATTGSPSA